MGDISEFRSNYLWDIVTCFETIEHVVKYQESLNNIRKLINKNGILFISSPNRNITSPLAKRLTDKPSNEFHTQEFTIEEFKPILKKSGFKIKDDIVYGQRMRPISYKNFKFRKVRDILFHPDNYTSAKVLPIIKGMAPRYFTIIAEPV